MGVNSPPKRCNTCNKLLDSFYSSIRARKAIDEGHHTLIDKDNYISFPLCYNCMHAISTGQVKIQKVH